MEHVVCPECGATATSLSVDYDFVWVLRDEYKGMVGLPAGLEFGRQIPVSKTVTYGPCQHWQKEPVNGNVQAR